MLLILALAVPTMPPAQKQPPEMQTEIYFAQPRGQNLLGQVQHTEKSPHLGGQISLTSTDTQEDFTRKRP